MVSSSTVLMRSPAVHAFGIREKQRMLAILGSTTQPNFFYIIFTSSSCSSL
ncbi:unnamed protein product [Brassica rapa subsp. trilocularis]